MVRTQNQPTIRVYDSGTITATTTTDTHTTEVINGEVIKIEIIASASTDFKVLVDASDSNTDGLVDQYLLGAADGVVTVNTTGVYYPVVAEVIAAAAATTDPDQYSRHLICDALEVAVTNIAENDTYQIKIYYIPYRKI